MMDYKNLLFTLMQEERGIQVEELQGTLPEELKLKSYDFLRLEGRITSDVKENETMTAKNDSLTEKFILI